MDIKLIYQSIDKEMAEVEARLGGMFTDCQHGQIVEIGQFLMSSPGKRLRPAMVILSARACSLSGGYVIDDEELAATATAVELIHTASLIHDDIVDRASMRHNRQSINSRWGDDVSLIFGDYIYTKAFNILSSSRKEGVLACLSDAIHTMCEGELRQILQRDAADMSEVSYEAIIEKKTASLFAACCEIGSVLGSQSGEVQVAMREFGMNFGSAFQIADDMRDIVSEKESLGKEPGQDVSMGEMTLPLLNLLDSVDQGGKARLTAAIKDGSGVAGIRQMYLDSDAPVKTRKAIVGHAEKAKECLSVLEESEYLNSLTAAVDQVVDSTLEYV